MSSQKGWGNEGGKNSPYDKGKGKGYGSVSPWISYNPSYSKGKGKGQWGSEKGYTKGGKGAYTVEQEWCPTTSPPDTADAKATQMAAAQAALASALANYNSLTEAEAWNGQEQEVRQQFSLSQPPPTPWESPSHSRTFRPSTIPAPDQGWKKITPGRFGALIEEDTPPQRILMLVPEQDERPNASLLRTPAPLNKVQDSVSAGVEGSARFPDTGAGKVSRGNLEASASVEGSARFPDTGAGKDHASPIECEQVGSTSTSQYNCISNRIPIIPLATLIAGTVKAEEPKTMQEPLEVIVYPRQEIRKEFKQYLETLNGVLDRRCVGSLSGSPIAQGTQGFPQRPVGLSHQTAGRNP